MRPSEARISPFQLAMLLIPGVSSTAVILLPSSMATFAAQDAWLGPLVAVPTAILTIWIAGRLAARFPGETFAEYVPRVIGKLPGKVVGLLFFWYLFQVNAAVAREFGDFLVGTTFPRTPLSFILGIAAVATASAVRFGPEILGRVSELFTPISVILILVIIAMAYNHFDLRLLQPVLEHGYRPVIDAAVLSQGFLGQIIILVILLPSVKRLEDGLRASYRALAAIVVAFTLVTLASLVALGPLTAQFHWPFLKVARLASIGPVLARIDPLIVGFWIGGSCLKFALHLYAGSVVLAQVFGLRDFRRIVFPLSALMSVYGVGFVTNMVEASAMSATFWPPFNALFQLAIPGLVLAIAAVRRQGVKPRAAA